MSYPNYSQKRGNWIPSAFTGVIVFILLGAVAFSILRNIRGLETGFPGVGFEWQLMIALVVTFGSVVLTGSSVLKAFDGTQTIRGALLISGLMFSLVSFVLSFNGATVDFNNRFLANIEESPEVVRIKEDLNDNLARQQEYGIDSTKAEYLLMQETYLRNDLAAARDRARHDATLQKEKAEKDSGKISALALGMFCALPEVGIIVFSLLLVLVTGQSVFSGGGIIKAPAVRQAAEVSVPEVRPVARVESAPAGHPSNNGVLHPEPAENNAGSEVSEWDPFK